jgi:hypothetical protein
MKYRKLNLAHSWLRHSSVIIGDTMGYLNVIQCSLYLPTAGKDYYFRLRVLQ